MSPDGPPPAQQPDFWRCTKCGCFWRDNHDDSVSLANQHEKSCEVCELSPTPTTCEPLYLQAALTAAEATRLQVEQELIEARQDFIRLLTMRIGEKCEHHKASLAILDWYATCECPLCWKACAENLEQEKKAAEAERDALIAQLEIVREILGRVGKHPSSCPLGTGIGHYKPPPDAKCNCGLTAVLKGNIGNR